MTSRFTRRSFLAGTAGAALGAALPARAARADRIRLGIIGVGGRGSENWRAVAHEEIVALCDVDLARIGRAAEQFPQAQVVQDFRRVLDRPDVDAVVISTPDHGHGIIAARAMLAGKHVYCEKPLARTIGECRALAGLAAERRLVTQMGTQIHAGRNYRRVVELVRSGAIGPVRRVDVWCEKQPGRGRYKHSGTPPATLDYDLWIGPAPMRPFDPELVPHHWRWWWDFGGGVLADMACHFMDLPHWALDLRHPTRVYAAGTEDPQADNRVPVEMRVDFEHPATSARPAVRVTWWHGITGPRDESGRVLDLGFSSGILFHGDQGQLIADYNRHRLLPEERFRDFRRPDPWLPPSPGHQREWLNAIRNGRPTSCGFAYGGMLSEVVLLGNVAYRLRQPVDWNPDRLQVMNAPGADRFIHPEFRGSWSLRG